MRPGAAWEGSAPATAGGESALATVAAAAAAAAVVAALAALGIPKGAIAGVASGSIEAPAAAGFGAAASSVAAAQRAASVAGASATEAPAAGAVAAGVFSARLEAATAASAATETRVLESTASVTMEEVSAETRSEESTAAADLEVPFAPAVAETRDAESTADETTEEVPAPDAPDEAAPEASATMAAAAAEGVSSMGGSRGGWSSALRPSIVQGVLDSDFYPMEAEAGLSFSSEGEVMYAADVPLPSSAEDAQVSDAELQQGRASYFQGVAGAPDLVVREELPPGLGSAEPRVVRVNHEVSDAPDRVVCGEPSPVLGTALRVGSARVVRSSVTVRPVGDEVKAHRGGSDGLESSSMAHAGAGLNVSVPRSSSGVRFYGLCGLMLLLLGCFPLWSAMLLSMRSGMGGAAPTLWSASVGGGVFTWVGVSRDAFDREGVAEDAVGLVLNQHRPRDTTDGGSQGLERGRARSAVHLPTFTKAVHFDMAWDQHLGEILTGLLFLFTAWSLLWRTTLHLLVPRWWADRRRFSFLRLALLDLG